MTSSVVTDSASCLVDPFADDVAALTDSAETGDGDDGQQDSAAPTRSLRPTLQLQIETAGKALLSAPGPGRMDPIPTYVVDEEGLPQDIQHRPAFVSMRQSQWSGDCTLVAGGAPWRAVAAGRSSTDVRVDADVVDMVLLQTLSRTTYKCGPGRPPQVWLGGDDETFAVRSRRVFGRAHGFDTRLGSFEWRYGSRAERLVASSRSGKVEKVDSLLVLDRLSDTAPCTRRPVARLIRSATLRSRGSSASSAGSGGRLQLDHGWLAGEEISTTTMTDRDSFVVLAVTTCLVMLKKEVDRRRGQQIAIMVVGFLPFVRGFHF
ncbi:hypothetical protein CMQ_4558 [Grosmannia clavigera kw1407]|uniref:Uncharacterized protein n=1 Tax=Grosmannia clavigera (strain kw1407 / UAMH 11150) TaxID=655863 RepID=F0XTP4_GROCL|nr:uncharacterized protein CMQ_4558 [Grosmannia clavigera kw1407]EFW98706.1 hypothetical protein CMQ_4558 [Grosmannia clavigera kw1407]